MVITWLNCIAVQSSHDLTVHVVVFGCIDDYLVHDASSGTMISLLSLQTNHGTTGAAIVRVRLHFLYFKFYHGSCLSTKVGNGPVHMSINQTSGHYWLKLIISGRLVVEWSFETTVVNTKIFSICYPLFTTVQPS